MLVNVSILIALITIAFYAGASYRELRQLRVDVTSLAGRMQAMEEHMLNRLKRISRRS